jgi:hypothetical protein
MAKGLGCCYTARMKTLILATLITLSSGAIAEEQTKPVPEQKAVEQTKEQPKTKVIPMPDGGSIVVPIDD